MRKLFAITLLITFLITIYSCEDEVEYKLSEDACIVFDQTYFVSNSDTSFIIPNVITPNNDGKNDYFRIINIEYFPNNTLTIYDRNHNQIANFSPYTNNWNGGSTYGNGLYYFKITTPSISYMGSCLSIGDDDDYYDISLSDCNCTGGELATDMGDPMLAK